MKRKADDETPHLIAPCGGSYAATPLAPALAVNPDEVLDDPALEARARAKISAELRCVVCQNQSIDDSDAEIARDLRLLVRERLVAGDNDEQVSELYCRPVWRLRAAASRPGNPTPTCSGRGPPLMAIFDRHALL